MKKIVLTSLLALTLTAHQTVQAESKIVQTPLGPLPTEIYQENVFSGGHHCQGIAVDLRRGYAYFCFTTSLLKTDLKGNIVCELDLVDECHLGCLELDPESGKIYASMEYYRRKNNPSQDRDYFYLAIIDTEKMTERKMNIHSEGVVKSLYLPEVMAWSEETFEFNGKKKLGRYGCSGIDGVSIGPDFGKTDGTRYLNIAFGILDDPERPDNDHNILVQYKLADIEEKGVPIDPPHFHKTAPQAKPKIYFVYTGNTDWGIQNLDYDHYNQYWYITAYVGQKPHFPNYSIFAIDGKKKARKQTLKDVEPKEKQLMLTLADDGLKDQKSGVRGWYFPHGGMGFESLGEGYYYIAEGKKTPDGRQACTMRLYKWNPGNAEKPFVPAE